MRLVHTLAAAAIFSLSACGHGDSQAEDKSSSADAPAAEASPSGPSLATAPAAFAQCSSCHSIRPGLNAVGPSLYAVVGRKAGSLADYAYSPALKASGKVWDEATLDTWLAGPMQDVPGTKMTYAGLADPAKRKEIIAYLKTLK
jgi:cytochrome c